MTGPAAPPHMAKENKDKGEGPSLEGAFSGHCERLVDSSNSSVQHPAIVCRCRGGWLLFGPRGQCQWRGVLAAVFSQCIDQVPEVYGEPFVSFGY